MTFSLVFTHLRPVITSILVLTFSVQLVCQSYNPRDFRGIQTHRDVRHRLLAAFSAYYASLRGIQAGNDSQSTTDSNSQNVSFNPGKQLSSFDSKQINSCLAYHIADSDRTHASKCHVRVLFSVLLLRYASTHVIFPCTYP